MTRINVGLERRKGVGEGGGAGGTCPHFQKWGGGGTSGFVPPPLFGRANVLISLFAHILWLKTHLKKKNSWLASLAKFYKSIFSKFC